MGCGGCCWCGGCGIVGGDFFWGCLLDGVLRDEEGVEGGFVVFVVGVGGVGGNVYYVGGFVECEVVIENEVEDFGLVVGEVGEGVVEGLVLFGLEK